MVAAQVCPQGWDHRYPTCDYRAGVCTWAKTFNKEVGPSKEFEKYSRCGCKQGVGSDKVIREPKSVEPMKSREGGGNRSDEVVGGELFDRVGGPITGGEVECKGDGSAIRSMACIGSGFGIGRMS